MTSRKKIFPLILGATLVVVFFFAPNITSAAHLGCETGQEEMSLVETLRAGSAVPICIDSKTLTRVAEGERWCDSGLTIESAGGIRYCIDEDRWFSITEKHRREDITARMDASPEERQQIEEKLDAQLNQTQKDQAQEREDLLAEKEKEAEFECGFLEFGCWIVNVFFGIPAFIFKALFSALAALVSWAITTLIDIPVLPGGEGTPHFVTEGWKLTRDLVNLLFLIVLVFIGFATILRLQSYEMKKTLPMLLIMALLINFSGTLVGLIVDIANIITNFFVSGISHVSWDMMDTWKGAKGGGGSTSALMSYHLSRIAFYSIASFVYLSIIAVFFLRIIVLWVLVILAPFAFAAYILPSTRSTSTKWMSALIQWAFVGVPLSFFILLSALTLEGGSSPGALMQNNSGAFANFLAPFTSLVILMIGVGISISSAPSMAGKVMGFGKAYGKIAGKWAGQKAETKLKLPEGAKKAGKWLMRNPVTSRMGGVGVGRLLTGYAKGAQKRREDTVQGLSLGQQAGGMGRKIPEHVRQMSPDNFVENVDATEITPEVFHAMTVPQIKAVGAKGTPEQIDVITDIAIKDPGHKIRDAVNATPPPPLTPEQRSIIAKVNELTANTSFVYP